MLHTFRVSLLILITGLGFIPAVLGQSLPEKLNAFLQKQAAGKITLSTNKPYYAAGDTVFFRVSNWQQNADDLLEVQLITPDPKLSQTTQVLLTNGYQLSYLILPKEAISGDYIVRAFSPVGWEASTVVQVYNPDQKTTEYHACNWINAVSEPKLNLTKQVNDWEITWDQKPSNADGKGWLFITGANQLYHSAEVDLSLAQNKISVPLTAFPGNQAQVMLATASGEIISNYTFRLKQSPDAWLQLNLNKTNFVTREPAQLQLTANTNNLANAQIMVRVVELTDTLSNNINLVNNQSYNYSFEKTFPQVNLKKIFSSTSHNPDYPFVLQGQLISAIDKKPLVNSLIHLVVPATSQTEIFYSDKLGRIKVELDPFAGTKPIIFRAIQDGEEVKNIAFVPDSNQYITSWQPVFTAGTFSPTQQEFFKKIKILNRVNQAFYAGYSPENLNRRDHFKPAAFQESRLKPTTSYDLSKYEKFSNVTEIFRELIPAIEVVKRKDGMRARLYARLQKKFYNFYPLFLIDGIPTYDVETILNLPTNQLAKIDVFNTSAALAPFEVLGAGGVIALYTQNRNFNPSLLHDNMLEFAGTTPAYKPKFLKNTESTIPNFNPLVYWNPQVKPEANGSVNLSFFTNDQIGRFLVEVTTWNEQGEEIITSKSFTVEAPR
ncbi:hypothetical protein HUW51_20185 [Adhaeribacter swui]|uniref:MG2 domain-containing protein n=1 Tax=Adhaeribacter swui TaxID=2086471 RepID=A0A7G7GCP3_9BACT|nr:hypothetical protein [Adhaeribacter swui]QNF34927.1 hypothetical protein HUW51_20185 [Adhaeribacter swui]